MVRIRLLGSIEVAGSDVNIAGTKQRLALTLLAVRAGQVVPTDTLVDLLWPSDPPADPQRSLQVHVSNLRRVLDDADLDASIEHQGEGYVLRLDPDVVDVRRFEELAGEGMAALAADPHAARALLVEALLLWRGHPLGGLGEHPALRGEVTRLEDLHLRALEARIDADLATGRHEEAAGELRRLTDRFPLREGLWGRLMVACYRAGRQGEALEAYERARRILAEELGVDPSPALRQLHGRILDQDETLDTPQHTLPTAPGGSTGRPAQSLAILPFDVIGETEDAAMLAMGLHNDLLTELSKVAELTVISRTSVLGYRGTDKPVRTIARELNVGTIVEGTVQGAGRRLRLTVQLVDGNRDVHRWAESYDEELTAENLFSIQSDLARDIAASLSAELVPSTEGRGGDGPQTESLAAYRLAAEARQHFDLKTEAGFLRAIELFDEATELDPEYTAAWVGLADALASMEAYGHGDRHDLLPRAEKAVHRALALDLDSAGARTSLGMLHTTYQDGPAAIRELERAIRVQPSYADAHNWHSWVSFLLGRAGPGLGSAQRATELDPLSAEAFSHLALGCAATGEPERGVSAARRARRLSPYTTADLYHGLCLYELGDDEGARAVLEPLTVMGGGELGVPWAGHGPDAVLALALARSGDLDAAHDVLASIDHDDDAFAAGLVLLGLGEHDRAAAAFDRVERVGAWPALAIHHYHRDVWDNAVDPALHDRLRRAAHRSWRMG